MVPASNDAMPLLHATGHTPGPVAVYFESFTAAIAAGRPTVVMIHGGAHSGECFQRTADGRPGWAYRFAARGYPVVVPDWPGIGRSGHVPLDKLTGHMVVEGLGGLVRSLGGPLVLLTHSMAGCYGWRLAELHRERVAAVVAIAPAPPGNIQPAPTVLSETEAAIELETFGRRMRIDKSRPNLPSADAVAQKYVGASSFFPRAHMADYATRLLAVPPRILMERRNVNGSQVRVSDPRRLAGLPVIVLTGTADIDHPRDVDEAIVTWLNGQSAKAEFCFLADRGIAGNGHMMMLEQNSDMIAGIIIDWLDAVV